MHFRGDRKQLGLGIQNFMCNRSLRCCGAPLGAKCNKGRETNHASHKNSDHRLSPNSENNIRMIAIAPLLAKQSQRRSSSHHIIGNW